MSFLRKKNKTWHIIDIHATPKERSLKTTDEKTANDYWHTYELNKSRLNLGLGTKNASIHAVVAKYKESIKKAPGTKARDDLAFKNYFRHCPIETVEEFSDEMARKFMKRRIDIDGVKESTVNRDMTTLHHFGEMLRIWKYCLVNPLQDVEDFEEMDPDTLFFTEPEVKLILKDARGVWYTMFFFMVNTGCRLNEILSLRWDTNIRLSERTIMIQAPKTRRIRYIPMTDALYDHLGAIKSNSCNDTVICDPDGKQPSPGVASLHWRRVLNRLKIKKPGLSLRNTRHTCATHLLAQGVPLETIQRILGHASPAMTGRYAKMQIEQLRAAIRQLPYGKSMATKKTTK